MIIEHLVYQIFMLRLWISLSFVFNSLEFLHQMYFKINCKKSYIGLLYVYARVYGTLYQAMVYYYYDIYTSLEIIFDKLEQVKAIKLH